MQWKERKKWENWKIPAWQLTKIRNFCFFFFSKEGSRTPRWHCEGWFRIVCSIYWAEIISITKKNSCKKSCTLYQDYRDVQDKQQTQYPPTPRSKRKMHHHCVKRRNRNVQIFGYVYQSITGQQSWSGLEDPVVPLERNLYSHPLAGLLSEQLFVNLEEGPFIIVIVCGRYNKKLARKQQNINPTWKILLKYVDLREATWCFDHVYSGCTQRQSQISTDIADNYKFVRILDFCWICGILPEIWASRKLDANTISSWSCDMEGHAKKCVERYCELANKTTG